MISTLWMPSLPEVCGTTDDEGGIDAAKAEGKAQDVANLVMSAREGDQI